MAVKQIAFEEEAREGLWKGVEKLARGDERHKPKTDAWDTNPDVLNTEEGKDHER